MALAEYHLYIDQVRHMIEDEKLTQDEVARRLGKNRTTIQRWCYRYGLETQRTGPRGGELHPDWKGGRKLVGRYWYVYRPDHPNTTKQRYVAEHRLVAEQTLGRYLQRNEVVHHIDGNPQNNDPSNLEVFQANRDHLKHELTGRRPNWTAAGRQRTIDGVRRGNANRLKSKPDADQPLQTPSRPSSSPGSTDDV